jgi:hypothetical protein
VQNQFSNMYKATIGADFCTKDVRARAGAGNLFRARPRLSPPVTRRCAPARRFLWVTS